MAGNITRFDPLSEFARMAPLRSIDEFFRELAPRALMRDMQEPTLAVEVMENDQAYTVRAEIPGVKKEDIKVDVHGNRLSISAEIKRESQQKEGDRILRSELYYGQVQRALVLDHEVDNTKAEAKYNDGVLELTLPKRADVGGTKLQIH